MFVNSILLHIKKYMEDKGFNYPTHVVDSLFLALKSQSFAIISGNTGVGKTSLAKLFCEAIGANAQNGRFLHVQVQSGWDSPKALLGGIASDGSFIAGMITEFLKTASVNREMPHFICLDDFNMSRPEQYMSPVLSALSMRCASPNGMEGGRVHSRANYGKDNAAYLLYGDIEICDNVYIIATMSSDEISYPLAPKVLDQSFVIDLESPRITFDFKRDKSETKIEPLEDIDNTFLLPEYYTSAQCDSDLDYLQEASYDWDKLNSMIKNLSSPLAYRSRDAMLFYATYSRRYDVFNNDNLTDMFLMQKLLVRIYGANTYVKSCLCNLFQLCLSREATNDNEYPNTSYKMYHAIMKYGCKYPHSANKITYMLRRFEEDGYATYWQR